MNLEKIIKQLQLHMRLVFVIHSKYKFKPIIIVNLLHESLFTTISIVPIGGVA